jgi:ABC-type transport system substrate-binding protein
MARHWYRNPLAILPLCLLLILTLAVACGTAEVPTSAPQADATAPPAAAPGEAMEATTAPSEAMEATTAPSAAPTAMPESKAKPVDRAMAGAKHAPSFESYWTPDTGYYGQPVYGGTLRINYEDPLEHANVWGARTGAAVRTRSPAHDQLITHNPYDEGAGFIPDLAFGWTIDDDLQGVSFFLREGVKWHNGADFVCEDARFSYETMLTGEGLTLPFMKSKLDHVDLGALECVDDFTLKFGFNAPNAVPLMQFGRTEAKIFNKEWFLSGGEKAMFQDLSVGTGPFMWVEGQEVGALDHQIYEKNPNYFLEGIPYVDELLIFGILDEGAQQAAQLAHLTDWHWVRNFGQYDAYVDHEQILTVIRATRSSENIWPNFRNPPFDNVRVRQAITMGFDKKAAIAVTLDGYGSQGLGLMPPGSPWAVELADACNIPGWCPNPDMEAQRAEAIQILKEENFDFDKVYVLTVESDRQRVSRATLAQEQLRLLGIKTDFDLVETVAYRKQSQLGLWGDFIGTTGGVSGVDDPFVGLGHYYTCATLYNFQTPGTDCDQEVEALFQELGGTIDPAARLKLGQQIQLRVMSQYWTTPYLWEQEAVSFWPEVRGYYHFQSNSAAGMRRFWHMWIDPAHLDDKGNRGQVAGVPGGE